MRCFWLIVLLALFVVAAQAQRENAFISAAPPEAAVGEDSGIVFDEIALFQVIAAQVADAYPPQAVPL